MIIWLQLILLIGLNVCIYLTLDLFVLKILVSTITFVLVVHVVVSILVLRKQRLVNEEFLEVITVFNEYIIETNKRLNK